MQVSAEIYAGLSSQGRKSLSLELPAGATIRELIMALEIDEGHVGLVVVNQKSATMDQVLAEGDRITLIPFLGGG